jgi:hypothetical protein
MYWRLGPQLVALLRGDWTLRVFMSSIDVLIAEWTIRRWRLGGKVGHGGCTLEGYILSLFLSLSLILLLSLSLLLGSSFCCHGVLFHHKCMAVGPADHGWKPLKPWTKMSFSPFKSFPQVFCQSKKTKAGPFFCSDDPEQAQTHLSTSFPHKELLS